MKEIIIPSLISQVKNLSGEFISQKGFLMALGQIPLKAIKSLF